MSLPKEVVFPMASPPEVKQNPLLLPETPICAARIYYYLVDDSAQKVARAVFFSNEFPSKSPEIKAILKSPDFKSAVKILTAIAPAEQTAPKTDQFSTDEIKIVKSCDEMIESDLARLLLLREMLLKGKRHTLDLSVEGQITTVDLKDFPLLALMMAINQALDSKKGPSGDLRLAIDQPATVRKPRRSSET